MSSVSNLTAARALISALPREELQNLNKEIRQLIASAPKEKKEKKSKRPAAVGQLAWFAFMAHCRATLAERFTTCKSAPDYAVVCKAIRQEDEAAYTAFVEKFKAENSAPASDAEVSSDAPAPAAPPDAPALAAPAAPSDAPPAPATKAKLTPEEKEAAKLAKALEKEQKSAAKSAEKEQKSATKSAEKEQKAAAKSAEKAEKEAAKAAKAAEKAADKLQKSLEKQQKLAEKEAAKEAAKAAKLASKPAKAKPAAKKATPTAPISADATPALAEPQEDDMPKMTIAGTAYWHDESTNGLYSIDAAGGFGDWVGYFQPDNEEEPIRYTASPE
jgi:hypothetical protein